MIIFSNLMIHDAANKLPTEVDNLTSHTYFLSFGCSLICDSHVTPINQTSPWPPLQTG